MQQKNAFGAISALTLLLWVIVYKELNIKFSIFFSGVVFSIFCLSMAKSSTALTLATLSVVVFLIFFREHIRSPMWLLRVMAFFLILMFIFLLIYFSAESEIPGWQDILEPFANLFGKHADLTGRTSIWDYVWMEIDKHWILGIGYGAFWMGPGSPSQWIIDRLNWVPLQGHNGYIDMLNELGLFGASILFFY